MEPKAAASAVQQWKNYFLTRSGSDSFEPGSLVLDVGCFDGRDMEVLEARGCQAVGIDVDWSALCAGSKCGRKVLNACGERIPIKTASLDGLMCNVALPFMMERLVLKEFGRVLKPNGMAYLSAVGFGYYLRCIFKPRVTTRPPAPTWKTRVYGLRTLINTWFFVLTGRRLPGFLGDTLYQTRRRLRKCYQCNGLSLVRDFPSLKFCGLPVLICHFLRKVDGDDGSSLSPTVQASADPG